MRAVFRRSARAEQTRFVFLGLALFALSWFLLDVHWAVALFMAGGVAGAFVLGRIALSAWRSSIVADEHGLESRRQGMRLRMAWSEISRIELASAPLNLRSGVAEVRCAVITDVRGRSIAFSDLSLVGGKRIGVGKDRPVLVHDVGEPEILLAIAADRVGDKRFLPVGTAEAAGDVEVVESRPTTPRTRIDVAGLGALVVKLGGKLMKALGSVFKTVKPGFAIASGAVYALIFDWKFVLGLMVILLFHEYGHVHAMRKSGLKVRGIYFIPLLGAAAVAESTWRTRSEQAYIALNGPLWGLYLTLPLFAASLLFGEAHPILLAMAAWWALVNLFNLLPINPLDGGRLLNAVTHSLNSRLGIAVSALAFVAAIVCAFVFDIGLFVVVGLFGLLEFVAEVQAASAMSRLRMANLGPDLPPESLLRLRLLVRPVFRADDENRLQGIELGRLSRTLSLARITPMPRARTILWGLLYLALAGGFAVIIAITSSNPAAGLALEILR
ncbi:MAG: site-2 protease family protein [Deltaproteobacteria bacterium]|nr:site-2 protease family protein [Deltaproteobacteria bacterium]